VHSIELKTKFKTDRTKDMTLRKKYLFLLLLFLVLSQYLKLNISIRKHYKTCISMIKCITLLWNPYVYLNSSDGSVYYITVFSENTFTGRLSGFKEPSPPVFPTNSQCIKPTRKSVIHYCRCSGRIVQPLLYCPVDTSSAISTALYYFIMTAPQLLCRRILA